MAKEGGGEIRIVKKKGGGHGHHGGAWKVAYADFVTAMMAFFLVMWLIGLDAKTRAAIAAYFRDPVGFMEARAQKRSHLHHQRRRASWRQKHAQHAPRRQRRQDRPQKRPQNREAGTGRVQAVYGARAVEHPRAVAPERVCEDRVREGRVAHRAVGGQGACVFQVGQRGDYLLLRDACWG
jgi:flagellar motor protein MotB